MIRVYDLNLHVRVSLWMKLHKKCQYMIDLTLRLNLVKIQMDLEFDQD